MRRPCGRDDKSKGGGGINGKGGTPGGNPVGKGPGGIYCPGRNCGGGGIPGNIIGELGDSTRNGEGTEFRLGMLDIPDASSTRFVDAGNGVSFLL